MTNELEVRRRNHPKKRFFIGHGVGEDDLSAPFRQRLQGWNRKRSFASSSILQRCGQYLGAAALCDSESFLWLVLLNQELNVGIVKRILVHEGHPELRPLEFC